MQEEHEEAKEFASLEKNANTIMEDAMSRLTKGLPRYELDLIIKEADECERALKQEISMLEAAISADAPQQPVEEEESLPFQYGLGKSFSNVDELLNSEYSTVDRFITLNAVLGRLFWPAPLPDQHPHAIALAEANKNVSKQEQYQKKQKLIERQEKLLALQKSPFYTKRCTSERWSSMLVAAWKKISGHKTALVFRRPVTDRDAPGYSERILFPMDLSLVRKLITSQQIQSFEDLHTKMALICHNCMKFNGAASDYGIVAKEFETFVDDAILSAVESAAARGDTSNAAVEPVSSGAVDIQVQAWTEETLPTNQKVDGLAATDDHMIGSSNSHTLAGVAVSTTASASLTTLQTTDTPQGVIGDATTASDLPLDSQKEEQPGESRKGDQVDNDVSTSAETQGGEEDPISHVTKILSESTPPVTNVSSKSRKKKKVSK